MARLAGTHPLTLSEALDMIDLSRRELPRAWDPATSPEECARRLAREWGFAAPTMTAERLAQIWRHNRG